MFKTLSEKLNNYSSVLLPSSNNNTSAMSESQLKEELVRSFATYLIHKRSNVPPSFPEDSPLANDPDLKKFVDDLVKKKEKFCDEKTKLISSRKEEMILIADEISKENPKIKVSAEKILGTILGTITGGGEPEKVKSILKMEYKRYFAGAWEESLHEVENILNLIFKYVKLLKSKNGERIIFKSDEIEEGVDMGKIITDRDFENLNNSFIENKFEPLRDLDIILSNLDNIRRNKIIDIIVDIFCQSILLIFSNKYVVKFSDYETNSNKKSINFFFGAFFRGLKASTYLDLFSEKDPAKVSASELIFSM